MDDTLKQLRSEVRTMASESEKIREILMAMAEKQSLAEISED
jgi:hypothetical protein